MPEVSALMVSTRETTVRGYDGLFMKYAAIFMEHTSFGGGVTTGRDESRIGAAQDDRLEFYQ